MIDHDRLFKELLTAFLAEFIEVFVPELARYLDTSSLEFLDKELFTDLEPGGTREPDLVVKVRFLRDPAFVLIHLEHQAQRQAWFVRRFFWYFAHLDEKHQLPVYPIAIFSHRSTRPEPEVYAVSFPDREVLRFRFRVIQLSRLRWRDFLGRPNPAVAALMARMGMTTEERPRVKLECLRLVTQLRVRPKQRRFLSGFIDTYLRLNPEETLIFQKQARTVLNLRERSKVMELTTSWKEEGRQEGRQEGQMELTLRQLRRRCGPLPRAVESQVRSLSSRQVGNLGEALLEFSGLPDLKRWLQRQKNGG